LLENVYNFYILVNDNPKFRIQEEESMRELRLYSDHSSSKVSKQRKIVLIVYSIEYNFYH